MEKTEIEKLVNSQKISFKKGNTKSYEYRLRILKNLLEMIETNQEEIHQALSKDLRKHVYESFVSETMFVINEINDAISNLKKWMRPKKVKTPMAQCPAKSFIQSEPFGAVLIIAPWNYPFQLCISPLIGAIASGNTVILKPSEISIHTSNIITKLIGENFDSTEVAVVEGGPNETNDLIDCNLDYIFYTGSTQIGKIIYQRAAKFLTPVTLELGGKSPCIILDTKEIDLAAKRIVWGKFFNAGQTCVAPDYILIDPKYKTAFVEKCQKYLVEFYGKNPKESESLSRIISSKHFDRLVSLLEGSEVMVGGEYDKEDLYFSPTIVSCSEDSKLMEEEIFGPILPILEKSNLDECIKFINERPKPLSLYLFTDESAIEEKVVNETSSGGLCINDTLVHLTAHEMPFGGVGDSGMGGYHGKFSFDTFSHKKAVMKRSFKMDLPFRYPPFPDSLKLIRKLLKHLG